MIPRKPLPSKPQLKPQISRSNNDPNIKLADIKLVTPRKTRPPLVLQDKLLLLDALQVTPNIANLDRASYTSTSATSSLTTRGKKKTPKGRTHLSSYSSAKTTAHYAT